MSARHGLDRAVALLVRYWAANMTLVHDQGTDWPGFGYTPAEKAQLRTWARATGGFEFGVWVLLVVFGMLVLAAASLFAGLALLRAATGQGMGTVPEKIFFLEFALQLVVALGIGLPLAMLPAAAVAGRWFEVAEAQLPEAAAVPHYLRKLCRQIARVALLAAGAVLALCLWMPETGRVHVLLHLVMPMLGPVVSVLTAVFYFGRRRQEDGFEGPGPQ